MSASAHPAYLLAALRTVEDRPPCSFDLTVSGESGRLEIVGEVLRIIESEYGFGVAIETVHQPRFAGASDVEPKDCVRRVDGEDEAADSVPVPYDELLPTPLQTTTGRYCNLLSEVGWPCGPIRRLMYRNSDFSYRCQEVLRQYPRNMRADERQKVEWRADQPVATFNRPTSRYRKCIDSRDTRRVPSTTAQHESPAQRP